jgi:hypothetical protein
MVPLHHLRQKLAPDIPSYALEIQSSTMSASFGLSGPGIPVRSLSSPARKAACSTFIKASRASPCRNIKKSHGTKLHYLHDSSVPYLLVFEFARVFNRLKPVAGRIRGTSDRLNLF